MLPAQLLPGFGKLFALKVLLEVLAGGLGLQIRRRGSPTTASGGTEPAGSITGAFHVAVLAARAAWPSPGSLRFAASCFSRRATDLPACAIQAAADFVVPPTSLFFARSAA